MSAFSVDTSQQCTVFVTVFLKFVNHTSKHFFQLSISSFFCVSLTVLRMPSINQGRHLQNNKADMKLDSLTLLGTLAGG